MIQFQNVYKTYTPGINAIDDVSFTIEEGEFVFLIGSSGSGKTTLIKMLIREENPSEGRIYFDNEDITKLSRNKVYQHRRRIGVIFQDYKLIEEKTSYENLEFVMEAAGKSQKEIKETVPYLLDIVGLADRQNSFPRELSGGEKQRVAIARALVNNPKLLIADEPTGNLDPEAAWDIVRILQKINDWGTTILMSTHGLDIVEQVAKRVLKITDGVLQDDYIDGYKTTTQRTKETFEQNIAGDIEKETENIKIIQKKKNSKTEEKSKNDEPEDKELVEDNDKNVAESNEETQGIQDNDNQEEYNEPKESPDKVEDGLNSDENDNKEDIQNDKTTMEKETKSPKLKISLVDKKKKNHPLNNKKKNESEIFSDLDLDKKILKKLDKANYNDVESIIEAGIEEISKIDNINNKEIDKIKIAVAKFIQNNS